MISRRAMICGFGIAAMGRSLAALSQEVKAKVGWLAVGPIPTSKLVFLETLEQRGYVEGKNLVLEERYPRSVEQYPDLVAELIRLKVDVLVTTGGAASRSAKAGTASLPIVFLTTDPIGTGLIPSLARPSGNLTGVALITQDFNFKRVETIVGMVPGITTVAALSDASGALNAATQRAFFEESEAAAKRLGIRLARRVEARSIDEVEGAFAAAANAGAGAMLTVSSSYFNVHKTRLVAAAAKARLPTIYEHRDFVEAGGLVSYGPDLRYGYRVAAAYVDKILKGAKPADLPVEQVSKVELVLNQRTAKSLNLTVPPALLLRADEIIR